MANALREQYDMLAHQESAAEKEYYRIKADREALLDLLFPQTQSEGRKRVFGKMFDGWFEFTQSAHTAESLRGVFKALPKIIEHLEQFEEKDDE